MNEEGIEKLDFLAQNVDHVQRKIRLKGKGETRRKEICLETVDS
jgi:hypothetical protein